jgi:peptidoglycan hydrolase CwlO-like protein
MPMPQKEFNPVDEMKLRFYASINRIDARVAQTNAQISRSQEMIERSRELLERFKERLDGTAASGQF